MIITTSVSVYSEPCRIEVGRPSVQDVYDRQMYTIGSVLTLTLSLVASLLIHLSR